MSEVAAAGTVEFDKNSSYDADVPWTSPSAVHDLFSLTINHQVRAFKKFVAIYELGSVEHLYLGKRALP